MQLGCKTHSTQKLKPCPLWGSWRSSLQPPSSPVTLEPHISYFNSFGDESMTDAPTAKCPKRPVRLKRTWKPQEDEKLIDAMMELHASGKYVADNGFKPGYAQAIKDLLDVSLPNSGLQAEPHIKSRLKTLKGNFGVMHDMVLGSSTSGFGWDPVMKLLVFSTMAGLTLSAGGWTNNLVVYLINEFNIKSIDATQITNIFKGCMNLFPILGAIFADSYFGLFTVISISSLASLLGIILLTFTAILNPLKPAPCEKDSSLCVTPSNLQISILYTSLALTSIGVAGTRFLLSTMGANQFDKPKQQGVFFNWYFFTLYVATLFSMVGIVYVEDNVGWGLGYGLCVAANLIGLVVFVLGKRYYQLLKPQGSPFTELARVAVAAFRKRKVLFSVNTEEYWQGPHDGETKFVRSTPTNSFRFLNHAALVMQGDTTPDGSIKKPWNLCTLQQVEDLKTIIRITPLWTTGIFLFTPIAIQTSLIVLQALAMDRHLGTHFQIPAGSMLVFVMLSTSIFLTLIDRVLIPMFQKLTGSHPTPLQRIGIGHVLVILSMAISAVVESKRLSIAQAHDLDGNSVVPMSAFWIAPQLVILGVAEAFYLPGQVSLYYQEFPKALKSTSSALVSMLVGIAFYLGTVVVDFISKITGWLPDGINDGRMDNTYWVLTVIVLINFGYYLVCSWLYEYQNVEKKEVPSSDPC